LSGEFIIQNSGIQNTEYRVGELRANGGINDPGEDAGGLLVCD
jgi:hypothetical protein